ncbi:hypothetical protein QEV83_12290 [Methylocapsa sp. D3K7]|uniref:pentapeptide repeat-containing protein n=1 Tax=Methylocapsa sp. D3K7 TaxID=3041435 RepID=UPI00244EAB0A|nr:hypothetical protein [Methylocapsa sp. D3K7]WGJ13475.1 hypothetical protein QEV83_12290 [Methylocapsa sp. D3K7]
MADETELEDEEAAEKQSNEHVKAFFLDLAAKGKEEWNAWRRDPANKEVRVTFAGIDFRETPRDEIDFSGFEFGDFADFSYCKWRGELRGAITDFAPGRAFFLGTNFGDWATFANAIFGDWADFTGAVFCDNSSFDGAIFGEFARFNGAAFGTSAQLRATFGELATFDGAAFGKWADFNDAIFKGTVEFKGQSKKQCSKALEYAVLKMNDNDRMVLNQLHEASWEVWDSGPDRFLAISFANTRFHGKADFSGRSFERTANFSSAHFYYPPDFDATTNASRIDFTGTQIGFVPAGKWACTKDSEVPVRLRAFRKIAEETKNHDLERDLYIEERKAERGVYWHQYREARNFGRLASHAFWIFIMFLYGTLADYGRSFARPLLALTASGFGFYFLYRWILSPLMPKSCPLADQYEQAVRMLALGNTVPFVGPLTIDGKIKDFLVCPLNKCDGVIIPPEGYQLAVLFQNLFSITCVFFIGLALRNYFKIK